MATNPSRFAWLYEMIQALGFNFNDALDIWATIDSEHSTGKTFNAGDNVITIVRGQLHLSAVTDNLESQPLIIRSIETAPSDSNERCLITRLERLPKEHGAFFDLGKVTFPLTIRRWQPGDRFRPSGMQGKSKR